MNVRILDTPIPSVEIHLRSDDYKFKFDKNDFLFQIHEAMTNPNEKLYYMSAELSNGEFPVSFFNVNETNNVFKYNYKETVAGTDAGLNFSHSIPVGNYNMGQLLTVLSSILNTSHGYPPLLSWSSVNNKLSIDFKRGYEIQDGTANKLFGLTEDVGKKSQTAEKFTASSMCDIRGYTNLFFHCDLFSNGYSTTTQKDNNSKNIMCRIPVDAGAYGTILYKPTSPHSVIIPKKSFKTFRVSIRDFEGRIVDMNLMKWSATMTIRFHKIPSIPNLHSSSISTQQSYTNGFVGSQTSHQLINYIKEITDEYKNSDKNYSKLFVN